VTKRLASVPGNDAKTMEVAFEYFNGVKNLPAIATLRALAGGAEYYFGSIPVLLHPVK